MIIRDPIKMRVECLGNEACDLLKGVFEGNEPISIGDKKFIITTIGKKSGNADPECTAIIDELFIVKNSAWNGEGLPPVGATVEIEKGPWGIREESEAFIGKPLTVVAVFKTGTGLDMVAVDGGRGMGCEVFRASMARPVRTAEQIAAEDREAALKQMQIDSRCFANRMIFEDLYDAGYRKQAEQ